MHDFPSLAAFSFAYMLALALHTAVCFGAPAPSYPEHVEMRSCPTGPLSFGHIRVANMAI